MFGSQRYDLRFRNMPWNFRDSYTGAAITDTKETAAMKKRIAQHIFLFTGALTAASLLLTVLL